VAGAMVCAGTFAAPAEARFTNGLIAYSVEGDACDLLGCTSRVWIARSDGRGRRRVQCATRLESGCVDRHPNFSPRGFRLATGTDGVFEGLAEGRPREVIAVRDSRGSILRRIPTPGRPITGLAWSGDGLRLAYNSVSPIYLVGRDGRGERFYRRAGGDHVAWSRQGRLAWTNRVGRLFVTDRSRRRVRKLPVLAGPPRWSPGGRRLAYITGRDNRLEIIDAEGSGRKVISRRCSADDEGVAWSPDGGQILCANLRGDLLAIRLGSRNARVILRGVFPKEFDWQARNPTRGPLTSPSAIRTRQPAACTDPARPAMDARRCAERRNGAGVAGRNPHPKA